MTRERGWAAEELAGHKVTRIQQHVAIAFGFGPSDLMGRGRKQRRAIARNVAMYLCRQLTRASSTEIGVAFDRHHTTVLHDVASARDQIAQDPRLRSIVAKLTAQLTGVDEPGGACEPGGRVSRCGGADEAGEWVACG